MLEIGLELMCVVIEFLFVLIEVIVVLKWIVFGVSFVRRSLYR